MSIGRDVYCDTRLILAKLEKKFPDGALGARQGDQKAVEKLLEKWTIDGGGFVRAAQLIPPDMPLINDPKFTKDREDYTGRSWAKADIAKMRPEALAEMRDMFRFLEITLLADGRDWILKTERPSLADIEGKRSGDSISRNEVQTSHSSKIPTSYDMLIEVPSQLFGHSTGSLISKAPCHRT